MVASVNKGRVCPAAREEDAGLLALATPDSHRSEVAEEPDGRDRAGAGFPAPDGVAVSRAAVFLVQVARFVLPVSSSVRTAG